MTSIEEAKIVAKALAEGTIRADEILEAAQADDGLGFCCACGVEADGVEPDARGYQCASCDEFAVFGAEELLLHLT